MAQDRTNTITTVYPTSPDTAEALCRARTDRVVRPARRTLAEMTFGYECQPLLRLVPLKAADEACGICGSWKCTGKCWSASPAPMAAKVVAR